MPVLQVNSFKAVSAFGAMISAISYPTDETKQSFFFKGMTKYVVSSHASAGFIKFAPEDQHNLIKLVGEAKIFPVKLDQLVEQSDYGRKLACETLEVAMSIRTHAKIQTSLEKTNTVLQWRYRGTDVPTSRESLKKAWRRYKSVSHLLLAFKLRLNEFEAAIKPFDDTSSAESFSEWMTIDSDEQISDEHLIELSEAFDSQLTYLKECRWFEMSHDEQMAFLVNKFGEDVAKGFADLSRLVEEMITIASYARQIAIDASQVYSHGRKKVGMALLQPSELWQFPEDFETKPVTVPYPPLSRMDLVALGISKPVNQSN
jgi:hypothetical protein